MFFKKYFYIYIFQLFTINTTNNPSTIDAAPTSIKKIEEELQEELENFNNRGKNYKPPTSIDLNFIKDTNIPLKEALHKIVYIIFLSLTPVTALGNLMGVYIFEDNKFYTINNYYSKFIFPSLYVLQVLFNGILPFTCNYFKFKITWWIVNNFLNILILFYLYNLDRKTSLFAPETNNNSLAYKNFYFINTISYVVITNIIIGISNLNRALKLNVKELIKNLDEKNHISTNELFF